MKRLASLVLGAVLAGSALPPMAQAQSAGPGACTERSPLVEHLRKTFGERRVGNGLSDTGVAIEVFAGPEGSFTIFATTPQGRSCLLIVGDAWEPLPQPERYAAR